MKLPQRPPSRNQILERMGSRLLDVIQRLPEIQKADRYLHWDDLRRRPTPPDLSHEEWWWLLKHARTSGQKDVPLLDKSGSPFVFGTPDQLAKLLHEIDRHLGFAMGLPETIKDPANRDQYISSSLIQESITSSQLEGATTTRQVAKEMLRTRRPPRDKHERMILNNYRTMERIRELRGSPLTTELVLELQTLVTEDTLDTPDAAGRFRLPNEPIHVIDEIEGTVFHEPPSASELPERVCAMCEFANGGTPKDIFIHPVIRAIILHFWLAYDHPFVDGNGRTARALFYWSMLRHNYELFEFVSISQIILRAPVKYGMAFLHTETDGNDLTYFILHQTKVIREAVAALHEYVRHKTEDLCHFEKLMRGVEGLNHRQQALLVHALREPSTRYTIVGHEQSHRVSHQTARNDLFDLLDRGLLIQTGKQGKAYVFRSVSDLPQKLEHLADLPPQPAEPDPNLPLPLRPGPQ